MPLPTNSVVNTIEEAKSRCDKITGSSACDKIDEVTLVINDPQLCPMPVPLATSETQAEEANTSANDTANNGDDKEVGPIELALDSATAQPAAADDPTTDAAQGLCGNSADDGVEKAEQAHQCPEPTEASAGSADTGAIGRKADEDVQVVDQAQLGDDDVLVVEAPSTGPRLPARRNTLRARALEELERGNVAEAFERMHAKLHADDEQIKEREVLEREAVRKIEEASSDLQSVSGEVARATAEEAEACKALREVEGRQREAKAKTEALRDELQQYKDVLIILDMKVAKRKADEQEAMAKRRKIEALEQVLEDSRREAEKIWQREQEAKEEMKRLMKEEKKLQNVRLGRFTMRHKQKMLKNSNEGAEAEGPAGTPATGTSPDASTSSAPALVKVKREVMQAFSVPRDLPEMVIVIEDESQ